MTTDERYFTIDEVAEKLRINPETVRRWLVSGKLPGFKVGDLWRVKESDFAKFTSSVKE